MTTASSMKSITLRSPAKLNLLLKVKGKRSDGYHTIETLFERVDICDKIALKLTARGRIRIKCKHPDVPKGPRNLVFKAARLIQKYYAFADGVDITIKKSIPVAAGLGGGSSNAAAVICGLSKLWKLSLTEKEKLTFAKQVGSDVPFFIYNCSFAVGTGRGDAIKPLKIRKKLWHVVVVPRTKVYSFQVYRALKLKLTKGIADVNMLHHALRRGRASSLKGLLRNDLETAIVRLHPNLLNIKNCINKVCIEGACFSGSGPAIFSVATSRHQALQWASMLMRYYKRVFVTRTL